MILFRYFLPPHLCSNMGKNQKLTIMTQTALLTAVMAVLAQLAVPMPSGIPLTLQTFGTALCAYLGGFKRGISAIFVYLTAGAAGVPLFSNFRGGMGILLGHTGGFLWGFIFLAACCGLGTMFSHKSTALLLGYAGLCICHLCGIMQYCITAGMGFTESFLLISLPYLAKDLFSVTAAYAASAAIRRGLKSAGIRYF